METSNHRVTHQATASVPAVVNSGPEPEKPETAKQNRQAEQKVNVFFIFPKTELKTFSVVPEK